MPIYKKDDKVFTASTDKIFDEKHDPGEETPRSGIYRCEVCGVEATSEKGNPLPPPSHHKHEPKAIKWRLVAAAKH